MKLDELHRFYYRDFFTKYEEQESQERIRPASRQLTRKRIKAKANLRWGEEIAEGSTDNVSLKGAFIRTEQAIPMENILIELFPPDESYPSIFLPVQVVRRDGYGIGVEFKDLSHEALVKLHSFLAAFGGT
jgi:hypothetical protein